MRHYLSPEKRDQMVALTTTEGIPVRKIAAAIGCNMENARSEVANLAKLGRIFTVRAMTDEAPAREVWCFSTAEARDAFATERAQAYKHKREDTARRRTQERKEKRAAEGRSISAAAYEREAKKAAARAQARAIQAAECEIAKLRRRLDREAASAEKDRLKLEAASQRKALRAMTKAAGALTFKGGTTTPKVPKSAWEGLEAVIPEGLEKVELPCNLRSKYEARIEETPALFSSLKPGQYIAPAPAWLQGVAA